MLAESTKNFQQPEENQPEISTGERKQIFYKLKPQELYENRHHMSAYLYLHLLIKALFGSKGTYQIANVTQFCERWGINRRTFYHARQQLIADGKLQSHTERCARMFFGAVVAVATTAIATLATPVVTTSTMLDPTPHTAELAYASDYLSDDLLNPQTVDPENPPSVAITHTETPRTEFDYQNFAWDTYEHLGDGGSDPNYWDYAMDRVLDAQERRKGTNNPIDEPIPFTRALIRNRGANGYKAYLVAIGKIQPPPKDAAPESAVKGVADPATPLLAIADLHWDGDFDPASVSDFSDAEAKIKIFWKHLSLSWDDPRLRRWIERAREWCPDGWRQGSLNMFALPNDVYGKLAHDLELTYRRKHHA